MPQNLEITFIFLLLSALLHGSHCQIQNPSNFYIQSKKYSVIQGQEFKSQVSLQKKFFVIPFLKAFSKNPDIGLSIYNLQFDYNPYFSIVVNKERSTAQKFQFYVVGNPSDTTVFNQLYIMYIASEYEQFAIYTPGPKNTTVKLGSPTSTPNRQQQFIFNYRNIDRRPMFSPNTNAADIRVTVYLTGIEAQSQLQINAYKTNSAHFAVSVSSVTNSFYKILVSVRSLFGDIYIKVIQFTVIYFDVTRVRPQYLMNAGFIVGSNFGGTVHKSFIEIPLQAVPLQKDYENIIQFFFGISEIQCSGGSTINFLSVERYNVNNNKQLQNLVLTLQTSARTYITRGVLNFIQYRPKVCSDPNICGIPCDTPGRPSFRRSNLDSKCIPCLYFCASCSDKESCTSCPPTRVPQIVNAKSICVCANQTLYDLRDSVQCKNCFDSQFCRTCSRRGVCQSCFTQANFVFNSIQRKCQCKAGMFNFTSAQNAANLNISTICIACAPECMYCTQKTNCGACTVPFYLVRKHRTISDQVQTCAQICDASQKYNDFNLRCEPFNGDPGLFDEYGRLGFDWNYKNVNNQMVVDLVFSQRNMTYYFYENGTGYEYVRTTIDQNQRSQNGETSVYYDDGNGYISGYSGAGPTAFQNTIIDTKITQQSGKLRFDQSALEGKYYGLGQARFYKQRYEQLYRQKLAQFDMQPLKAEAYRARYFDQFGIPFGKHQLSGVTIKDSVTFIDAVRNNLVFMVDNVSLPYTIRAISGNQFELIVRPQKSYLKSNTSIVFKNPALVRSNGTALQTPIVSKQIDRLDYYSQSQLSTARGLRDRTLTIVQILWGICKYILFIGFGWAVMPLMLILQYIFGFNYISTQLPLNLDYFLTSFADFRNPSILFNPQRNLFDAQVVNHQQIYKRVPAYYQFDRGIDFMKNSFQFFFTPLLSFGLQFIFIGLNYLLKLMCRRDFPIISQYLQPRLPLHAAAYTLVQALPISFFFFGQLQDQRYTHPNLLGSVYPSFNAGMSYASFFASAIIPLVLLTYIHHYFKHKSRSGQFEINKVKGVQTLTSTSKDPAMMSDPLWGGNVHNSLSYGFGSAVFYLPLLAGFVLSFFTRSYPWQLTGLLLGFAALASFAIGSRHFVHKVPKFFWVGIGALMIGYLLVHSGVGSNRALTTFDQWNTGYLGIGLIYAMLLAGIIFSGYLIYKLLTNLYRSIIKPFGCIRNLDAIPVTKQSPQQQQMHNIRDIQVGRAQRRNNTIAKSKINLNNMIHSQERFINRQNNMNDMGFHNLNKNYQQDLVFASVTQDGRANFVAQNSQQNYNFPAWAYQFLMNQQPLKIDSQLNLVSYRNPGNANKLGNINRFLRQQQDLGSRSIINSKNQINSYRNLSNNPSKTLIQMENMQKKSEQNLNKALNMIKNNTSQNLFNYLNINGQNYNYQMDQIGNFILSNANSGQKTKLSQQEFINNFIANKNKVNYNNDEYYVSQAQVGSQNQLFHYLINPNTSEYKHSIDRAQLLVLINSAAARNMHSTSLLPSNKSINSQFVGYQPFRPNQSILINRSSQQYIVNGVFYQREGESTDQLFLRSVSNPADKIRLRKSQVRMKSEVDIAQMASARNLVSNQLRQGEQVFLNNQRYLYKGLQNNYYTFANLNTNQINYFTIEQLMKYLNLPNSTYKSNSAVQPSFGTGQQLGGMPMSVVQLQPYSHDAVKNVVTYYNPLRNLTHQIPIEWLDTNQKVYIDKRGNIWHRGEKIHSQGQAMYPVAQGIQSFPSNSSLSIGQHVNPNQKYDIKLVSKNFIQSNNNIPQSNQIIQLKSSVWGRDVSENVNNLVMQYPNCKVFIENKDNPSQKFIIDFSNQSI